MKCHPLDQEDAEQAPRATIGLVHSLDGFPVVRSEIVRWGDLDAFGHVNNTLFFRYFESARIAYFERIGFVPSDARSGIGPILAATSCRFRRPLHYPDTLKVGARVVSIAEDRFTMEYAIWSETQSTIAAHGDGVIVAFDYGEHRKVSIPDAIRNAMLALEPTLKP